MRRPRLHALSVLSPIVLVGAFYLRLDHCASRRDRPLTESALGIRRSIVADVSRLDGDGEHGTCGGHFAR